MVRISFSMSNNNLLEEEMVSWQLRYVDLEATLNVIQDLRIVLTWPKGGSQTFGPGSSGTSDQGSNVGVLSFCRNTNKPSTTSDNPLVQLISTRLLKYWIYSIFFNKYMKTTLCINHLQARWIPNPWDYRQNFSLRAGKTWGNKVSHMIFFCIKL